METQEDIWRVLETFFVFTSGKRGEKGSAVGSFTAL